MCLITKAKKIRALLLDVDGVLTTGTLYYGQQGIELKRFHIHDGLGIKLLQRVGIKVAIISGKSSEALIRRVQELDIQYAYYGHENKLPPYEELKNLLQCRDDEIAYMGDDLPDLPLLRRVGLSITVPDASDTIKNYANMITNRRGGRGAVREICEFILNAQDLYQSVIQSYLS